MSSVLNDELNIDISANPATGVKEDYNKVILGITNCGKDHPNTILR